MISSLSSSELAAAQLGERLDQPDEILVRLDVADVQHELVIELVALPHARDFLLRRLSQKRSSMRVVDDDDLLRRRR